MPGEPENRRIGESEYLCARDRPALYFTFAFLLDWLHNMHTLLFCTLSALARTGSTRLGIRS